MCIESFDEGEDFKDFGDLQNILHIENESEESNFYFCLYAAHSCKDPQGIKL